MKTRNILLDTKQKLFEKKEGYIIYKEVDGDCEICLIEIDNAEKNKGEGTKLLNSFMDQ